MSKFDSPFWPIESLEGWETKLEEGRVKHSMEPTPPPPPEKKITKLKKRGLQHCSLFFVPKLPRGGCSCRKHQCLHEISTYASQRPLKIRKKNNRANRKKAGKHSQKERGKVYTIILLVRLDCGTTVRGKERVKMMTLRGQHSE